MPKRNLTAGESFDLRQALHVATLEAMMTSRRWAPGDLVFQGGTSLHLMHGSPRFSEDLDFIFDSALKLDQIVSLVQSRLTLTALLPEGMELTATKARDGRNPFSFTVTLGGPDLLGSVKVKVECWAAPRDAVAGIKAIVAPVRIGTGPFAGTQAFVPTADLAEIYADKVFALASRPYMKPRDIFDLHWLATNHQVRPVGAEQMRARLAIYPNQTPRAWQEQAFTRKAQLRQPDAKDLVATDLQRWLPSTWPLDDETVQQMVRGAGAALDAGIDAMREIERTNSNDSPSP